MARSQSILGNMIVIGTVLYHRLSTSLALYLFFRDASVANPFSQRYVVAKGEKHFTVVPDGHYYNPEKSRLGFF